MRGDMAKVIVERPRLNRHCRKGRRVALEDMPFQIGMIRDRREHDGHKQLNENRAPLRRFLHKQVGRRWDNVYSEIAANLRVTSTVQQHVRDHVEDFVDLHGEEHSWVELYVDPADGILKLNDRKKNRKVNRLREERERPVTSVKLDEMRELKLIDGVWFEVEYAPFPTPQYADYPEVRQIRRRPWDRKSPVVEYEIVVRKLISAPVFDVVKRHHVNVGPHVDEEAVRKAWRNETSGRYAIAKRQLSAKMLRHHGLVNV